MAATTAAPDLGAAHAVTPILDQLDGFRDSRL
jgi:hypothetical protein